MAAKYPKYDTVPYAEHFEFIPDATPEERRLALRFLERRGDLDIADMLGLLSHGE